MRTMLVLRALFLVALYTRQTASALKPLKRSLAMRGGSYLPPNSGYHALAAKGAAMSKQEVKPNLVSGAISGCYVAFGAVLSLTIASGINVPSFPTLPRIVFGLLFPISLLNIVATGSQLFTGNTACVSAAFYEGLIDSSALVRNWVVTYTGNLIGALLFALAFNYTGLLTGTTAKMAITITGVKCSGGFGPKVVKGIFANWLVCCATYMATLETDLAGKILGIWIPISAFVMIGFEHSIANLILLPLGLLAGAEQTWMDVITKNIIPVTIGNILAGAVFFAAGNSYLFGKLGGNEKD